MEERRGFLPCGTRCALPKTRQISSEVGQELGHHIAAAVCRHALVLLRHEREWCGGLRKWVAQHGHRSRLWARATVSLRRMVAKWVAQHGHRSRLWARATVSLRRMVAIEFGTCRSGRIGGAAGSITGGKVKCFELRCGRS